MQEGGALMRIGLATDHGRFALKTEIAEVCASRS